MYRKTTLFFLAAFLCAGTTIAQVYDDFSDGDFTSNPVWSGDTTHFLINQGKELQSDGPPATDTLWLSTANLMTDSTIWEFFIRMDFQPSSGNFTKVYLMSSGPNLLDSLTGYFLYVGETGSPDSLRFYRQDGWNEVLIGTGSLTCFGQSSNNEVRIRAFRSPDGIWSISSDCSGGSNFAPEMQVTDTSYLTTSHFGFVCRHTSTRNDKYYFDDVYIGYPVSDTTAPRIDSIYAVSANEVRFRFNEATDSASACNPANYQLYPQTGLPVTIVQDSIKSLWFSCILASQMTNQTVYHFVYTNVSDTAGNMALQDSISFYFFVPDSAGKRDVIVHEILADPSPAVGLPGAEFVELYNRSSKIFDLAGWVISDGNSSGTITGGMLPPDSFIILCSMQDTAAFSPFGAVAPVSGFPSLNNSGDPILLFDKQQLLIDSLFYSSGWYNDNLKEDGGWTLELINPEDTCLIAGNWTASVDSNGGTPGRLNSVHDPTPDISAPFLQSWEQTDSVSYKLCFSEILMEPAASDPGKFYLTPAIGNPVQVVFDGEACVSLIFADTFPGPGTYYLICEGQFDCHGNTMPAPDSVTIFIGYPGDAGSILISEFMADPDPAAGLPSAEFVEIANMSNQAIELNGWRFTDRKTTTTFPPKVLDPGAYLILCSRSDTALFRAYGNVLGLSSFPSLGNGSDSLELWTGSGELSDAVYYTDDWYKDEDKSGGGYSLERRDLTFHCPDPGNWGASIAAAGGTPGQANSLSGIYEDADAPVPLKTTVLGPVQLLVNFDQAVHDSILHQPHLFSLSPGPAQPMQVSRHPDQTDAVELFLSAALDSGRIYTLTIQGVKDCPGNSLPYPVQLQFGLPETAEAGDLIINEVLFNPYPGGSDFVEIYNNSNKILDLSSIIIGEYNLDWDSVSNTNSLAEEPTLILPKTYACFTADRNFQINTYQPENPSAIMELRDFPTYDDKSGSCIILTDSGLVIDRVQYLEEMHFVNLDDKNGVSLERIRFDLPSDMEENWHSAASTVKYATPGYRNSQSMEGDYSTTEVSISPEIFSPDGDGLDDVLAIHYHFTEPGWNARIQIYDSHGRMVRILQQNTLLSASEGSFLWDGLDEQGRKSPVGIYVVLFEAVHSDWGRKESIKKAVVLALKL